MCTARDGNARQAKWELSGEKVRDVGIDLVWS